MGSGIIFKDIKCYCSNGMAEYILDLCIDEFKNMENHEEKKHLFDFLSDYRKTFFSGHMIFLEDEDFSDDSDYYFMGELLNRVFKTAQSEKSELTDIGKSKLTEFQKIVNALKGYEMKIRFKAFLIAVIFVLLDSGCTKVEVKNQIPSELGTEELIETLRSNRIEELYYNNYPPNVQELMDRKNVIHLLTKAYHKGGDDLFRFNILVILNHKGTVSLEEADEITYCHEEALNDSSYWVRTEAVWGLGYLRAERSVPKIITLMDDPNINVVNETILTLARITGMKNLPVSNNKMDSESRRKAVGFWKNWWSKQTDFR